MMGEERDFRASDAAAAESVVEFVRGHIEKGLLRAGLDGFAHTVRDKDIDDEFVALAKKQKGLFYVPNLPDSGAKTDLSWLNDSVSAQELTKVQAGASTDRPDVQKLFGIQARNLARMNKEGFLIAMGTDGGVPWAHHLEMADMVAAGMTPLCRGQLPK